MASSLDADAGVMSLGEHIEELRRRLWYALLGMACIFVVTFIYGRTLISWLYEPLAEVQRLAGLPPQTYTRSTIAGFTLYIKVSFSAALILSAPWFLYQLWKFAEKGLYAAERRAALVLMSMSSVMSLLALVFMYYLFLPASLTFLILWTTSYPVRDPEEGRPTALHSISTWFYRMNQATLIPGSAALPGGAAQGDTTATTLLLPRLERDPAQPVEGQIWMNTRLNEVRTFQSGRILVLPFTTPSMMAPLIDPNDYLNEIVWMAIIIALVFHVPVVMSFLGMVGLGQPEWLRKRRRIVIFCCFASMIVLAPSQDLFTNIALPLLLWGLFELGLLGMTYFGGRREKRLAEEK